MEYQVSTASTVPLHATRTNYPIVITGDHCGVSGAVRWKGGGVNTQFSNAKRLTITDDNGLVGCFIRQAGEWWQVVTPIEASDFEEDDYDEFIERDGMEFCGACGILACPGEEEFDWCDHRTGRGCYHMQDSPLAEPDEDEWW